MLREGATVDAGGAARVPRPRSFAKWQLPDAWAFIDQVPRTCVGKFDKKVLRREFADGTYQIRRAGD